MLYMVFATVCGFGYLWSLRIRGALLYSPVYSPHISFRVSLLAFCDAGRIDSQEIMQSLRDLGVHISEQQAEKILKR